MENQDITQAYRKAVGFASSHYENFPVISGFLPKSLRKHTAIIYWFARNADDLADEDDYTKDERVSLLNGFEESLNKALNGTYENEYWLALHNTIKECKLTPANFTNLLKAFKQDVNKTRYANREEVLAYCKNSANPVGRLVLELHDIREDEALAASDNVCTGLQLANFWQDTGCDYEERNRIYIPKTDMDELGVKENTFEIKGNNTNFTRLMDKEVLWARGHLEDGFSILKHLPRRLRFHIKWTIFGGLEVLKKIEKIDYDVLNIRPKLTKIDYLKLLVKCMFITSKRLTKKFG